MEKSFGYLKLIRTNRKFRYLWFGQIVSLFGDWFNLIASAALIAQITKSGIAVGGLFVVRMLAPFLVSPFAGVMTDRINRKKLLVWSDLSRCMIVLGFLLVKSTQDIWLLYTLTALQLGIGGIFYPARVSILPEIVTEKELGAANALSSGTWSIMLSIGAALGGLATGQWGIYPSFLVDSASFLMSAIFIWGIEYERLEISEDNSRTVADGFKDFIKGLLYLINHKDYFIVATLKAANNLATGAFQVIQVYMSKNIYIIGEGGSTSLGLFYAVVGTGTGFGPIIVRKFIGDDSRKMRIAILYSYILLITGLLINIPLPPFWLILIGVFIRGIGGGINWVFSSQLLLQSLPNQIMGRVFSTEFALMSLTGAIATLIGGWSLDNPNLGFSGSIWIMVITAIAIGTLWMIWLITKSEDM